MKVYPRLLPSVARNNNTLNKNSSYPKHRNSFQYQSNISFKAEYQNRFDEVASKLVNFLFGKGSAERISTKMNNWENEIDAKIAEQSSRVRQEGNSTSCDLTEEISKVHEYLSGS